jgi:hypothetical protein
VLVVGALAAVLETRTVEVPVEARRSIRVECAVGTMTRVVFPEPLLTLRWSRGAREALGARLRSTAPVGIVEVQPTRLDTSGSLEARGPSQAVNVDLTVVPKGAPLEVRLVITGARRLEELGADRAASTPSTALEVMPARGTLSDANSLPARGDGAVETTSEPSAVGSAASLGGVGPETAAPQGLSFASADVLSLPALRKANVAGLPNTEVVPIGRREVQPGRREVVLLDALQGRDWVWFRFLVQGGARDHVEGLSWDNRQVDSYQAETLGRDLRLVVRIPRRLVKAKSKATLCVGGGEYRFRLRAGTLGALFGGPFQ